MSSTAPSDESWSISVKAIGSTLQECTSRSSSSSVAANGGGGGGGRQELTTTNSSTSTDNDSQDDNSKKKPNNDKGDGATQQHQNSHDECMVAEKNFTVVVSPEDTLTSLYDQIEDVTGLKASQQRLIYRGRIIPRSCSSSTNKKKNNHTEEGETEAASSTASTTAATRSEGGENDTGEDVSPETSSPSEAGSSPAREQPPSQEAAATPTSPKATTTTKIKDIVGLGDGHTIHLVKRQESSAPHSRSGNNSGSSSSTSSSSGTSTNGNSNNRTSSSTTTTNNNNSADREETLSGNGTASLLAALIGLSGGLEEGGGIGDAATAAAAAAAMAASRQRWRSRLNGGRTSRGGGRPHYRLSAEDLQPPDPGSMEPIRQNLMTIHTLLPHAQNVAEAESPLDANRQWYRGQWLDVRDTVNQWLEATVVEILSPDQLLPPRVRHSSSDNSDGCEEEKDETLRIPRRQILEPATDPAVGAGDLAGRRRLLLEPCDVGDEDDEGGVLEGFRRRANNEGVQLLLIHYNGWPHRWDEWIRSDSERIRPFRTRTRHPNFVRFHGIMPPRWCNY